MVDEFTRHEALDRAGILVDMFHTLLGDNELVQGNEDLSAAFMQVAFALGDLYQAIGNETYGKEYAALMAKDAVVG